ncbi:MAG: LysM peptidoglycan-binding domain-containing protein [Candidatus Aminicenantes bacterium]|nr:MAG: LysM peptidoglycan-binding domain-containing protein [Candidatus Aminicenantes bacterium]
MRYFKHFFTILLATTLIVSSWNCSHQRELQETQTSPQPSAPETQVVKEVKPEEKESTVDETKTPETKKVPSKEELPIVKKVDPSELLDEALYEYQDAQLSWEMGDFDAALEALDEAYSLILKLNLPPDSPLIQDKNNLRLLIAQRIQEIYASRFIVVGDNNKTIPLVENKDVKQEIESFQTKERKLFEEAYRRSGYYREMILEELRAEGLPEQLSWVPMIESWFKVKAFSRAAALGLWQFISSTGTRFGLKRDRYVDERMDPQKSTRAAIKYLNELHSLFGDWTTALAAYNCGEFRVQKVIRYQRVKYLDNFWDLYRMLPPETRRFVPRFIATLLIINDPEKYGFNLPESASPLRYETIFINKPVMLSSLSKELGLKTEELSALNPELRHDATPENEYLLKVPQGYGEEAMTALNSLQRYIPPEATFFIHYVRRGQTLSGIADRYRTSVSSIARLNRLRRVNLIRPGQRLKIPGRGRYYASKPPPKLTVEGDKLVYTVKRGDSLYLIANAFKTTVPKLKRDNNLRSTVLRIGQKLVIQTGKPEGVITYTVIAGDTPYLIAKKYGMNLAYLLQINGLTTRSKIYPGQELWVTPKK